MLGQFSVFLVLLESTIQSMCDLWPLQVYAVKGTLYKDDFTISFSLVLFVFLTPCRPVCYKLSTLLGSYGPTNLQ